MYKSSHCKTLGMTLKIPNQNWFSDTDTEKSTVGNEKMHEHELERDNFMVKREI